MKTCKKNTKKSICKTRGRKYRNKNNNKNTRNIIGGGIDTLDKVILKNMKNNQIKDEVYINYNQCEDKDYNRELTYTYQNVMLINDDVAEDVRIKKLNDIKLHIKKYIYHYTIALNALNELPKKYDFFEELYNYYNKIKEQNEICNNKNNENYEDLLEMVREGVITINNNSNDTIKEIFNKHYQNNNDTGDINVIIVLPSKYFKKFNQLCY